MSKSILQDNINQCYICGRNGYSDRLECHHIYPSSNRNNSEKWGLVVFICGNCCHRGKQGVHQNAELSNALKAKAQKAAMERYGWSEEKFRKIFGKSYLGGENEKSI